MSQIFLLTIRGTLAPPSLEAARQVHNQTAGAPEGVAAAKSLGDLSHMVYVPAEQGYGEIFIMDQWTSPTGLNQFFSDPQVQQGAAMIFTQRDPVVWAPAEGFFTYHLPAPTGHNDRYIGVIRGNVASREQARATLNTIASDGLHTLRQVYRSSSMVNMCFRVCVQMTLCVYHERPVKPHVLQTEDRRAYLVGRDGWG